MSTRPPDPFMPRRQQQQPQPQATAHAQAQAQAQAQAARAATAMSRAVAVDQPKPAVKQREGFWRPISTVGLVLFLLGTAWLGLLIKTDKDGFIQIIDSFNLVVHEFGHPLFANFGTEPGWWGGTLAQLLLPLVFAGVFVYQRYALSTLFCLVWFFENIFNVARYLADARAQELPLVSPGGSDGNVGHDWNHILGTLGQLENDLKIASTLRWIGWIGIATCVITSIVLWSRQAKAEAT